jgi:hypothetical protein
VGAAPSMATGTIGPAGDRLNPHAGEARLEAALTQYSAYFWFSQSETDCRSAVVSEPL